MAALYSTIPAMVAPSRINALCHGPAFSQALMDAPQLTALGVQRRSPAMPRIRSARCHCKAFSQAEMAGLKLAAPTSPGLWLTCWKRWIAGSQELALSQDVIAVRRLMGSGGSWKCSWLADSSDTASAQPNAAIVEPMVMRSAEPSCRAPEKRATARRQEPDAAAATAAFQATVVAAMPRQCQRQKQESEVVQRLANLAALMAAVTWKTLTSRSPCRMDSKTNVAV
mmetsp:Transcript_10692/g.24946  ORF Transcript_10692/g.24946 Transcript_10692/m.24946 type:complete len:226 (-) Transcript_10692:60-737(-)